MPDVEKLARLQHLRAEVNRQIVALGGPPWAPRPPRKPVNAAMCGTDGGYYRHVRTLGEPACVACLAAHAAYEHDRSKRAREGAA